MGKHRAIPSMYHRRLALISALMMVAMLLLAAQMLRLSVVEGAARLERAEQPLHRQTYLRTYRGSLIDRQGRKIAVDRPGYALAVNYDVITGDWETAMARRQARKEIGRHAWLSLSPERRRIEMLRRLPPWRARTERLFEEIKRLGSLDDAELERRLDAIRATVQRTAAAVWDRQRRHAEELYGDEEASALRSDPILEQTVAHVVLSPIDDEVAHTFRALSVELPEMFEVQDDRQRAYPWSVADVPLDRSTLPGPIRSERSMVIRVEGVADHICGSMRPVQAEDVASRPFVDPDTGVTDLAGYAPVGDSAGATGLERVFEDHLRGRRGSISRRLDTGETQRIDPIPGEDLHLTLDIVLQARIQAILSHEFGLTVVQPWHRHPHLPVGTPLNSAAVVLDVQSGEVLSMVSMPTRAMAGSMTPWELDRNDPYVDRPAEAVYPPGSILKPLVLAAAVSEGVHDLSQSVMCTGHYFPELKDRARCWIYRDRWGYATHGPMHAEDAIGQSCNIFFYTMADRLGMERLADWLRRFGLGSALNAGLRYEHVETTATGARRAFLTGEAAGQVPDDETIAALRAAGEYRFASIILGIGQGPIAWTPLQAANAYATLARGGVVRDATLIVDERLRARPKRCEDLALDPDAVDAAMEGLCRAVSEGGTGHHITLEDGTREPLFSAEAVAVWGKTGTAQAPLHDINGDGTIDDDERHRRLDHAWFVGLVGPADTDEPRFAIAVIVEFGGSGGRVAGPIANQIAHALQDEGYLPTVQFSQARAQR